MPAWIIAIRSRCSISRSARRFDIASQSTATPAKIINEKTIRHDLFFRHSCLHAVRLVRDRSV